MKKSLKIVFISMALIFFSSTNIFAENSSSSKLDKQVDRVKKQCSSRGCRIHRNTRVKRIS